MEGSLGARTQERKNRGAVRGLITLAVTKGNYHAGWQ
jgi:hypothetical protein